jgi:Spy/CpxP family protein refolding chaperone
VLKAQTRFTELQFQLQDNMETLIGLLKENPADEAQVLAQLEKVLNVEREVKRTQIALMVRIKNKLTPEQQARLHQLVLVQREMESHRFLLDRDVPPFGRGFSRHQGLSL